MRSISFMSRDALGNPALPATLENYATIFEDIQLNPRLFNASGEFEPRLFDGLYLDLFWRSLWLSLTSTVITLAIAFPVALFMARLPKHRRNLALIAADDSVLDQLSGAHLRAACSCCAATGRSTRF